MAQNAPASIDVQEIQFKVHDKFTIFPEGKELKSLVSLLAISSTKGLLFAGNPNDKELKVVKLKSIVDAKATGQGLSVRVVALPGEPKAVACSCDGSMLAVNYVLNNTGFLQVYQVDSFVTPEVKILFNVPVSPENCVFVLQFLWNPVIANNIALILSDGSVAMFSLNSGGQYDRVTLGKEHQIKSGCWSPKGKQIVFGFADGKLQQFKPNLQPARAIPCPPGIHPAPFDCIAVHWLSTFQFAAVFLQKGEDMCPSLFIINAPKTGNPSYINYYDICYSAPGPRIQQLTFNHISAWNLLLVSSANGVEVGILGTKETGENPTWVQYTLLDEARIEMPLTDAKDETYPIGFVFDTASSHNVKIGEQILPVMPMIHVLSTHGHLLSFNFLNLSPDKVDVCSPPPPLNDISGQFKPVQETVKLIKSEMENKPNTNESVITATTQSAASSFGDMTFSLGSNMVTSTPAIKDKPMPMFGALGSGPTKPSVGFGFSGAAAATTSTALTANVNKPSTGFGFGITGTAATATSAIAATSAAPAGFGVQAANSTFGGITSGGGFGGVKPVENRQIVIQSAAASAAANTIDANKPLYTVPATFKPPPVVQSSKPSAAPKINMNAGEIDEIVKQMIAIQIDAFEAEMKQIQIQARKLMENVGKPEEIKSYTKQLNDLQELIEQANDHEFEQDVQSLRHSMNESYAMLAECRTKLDMYNNPNLTRLTAVYSADPTNLRQLAKLQSYAASNQVQLNQLNHLIDAQWSQYQDIVRRNTKNHMHIPCLDGVYQRMSKLKDLLARQRTKMNHIRTKLLQKGLSYKPPTDVDVTTAAVGALTKNQSTMESLADSILSMSLSEVVSQTHAKLSEEKLNAIRNFTKQQQKITIIKPKRPDRIGLKSEVILETKLETERKQREIARQKQQTPAPKLTSSLPIQNPIQQLAKQTPQVVKPSQQQQPMGMQMPQQQPFLAKPTASKPPLLPNAPQSATFITSTSSTTSSLSFGSNGSFVKTSATPSLVTAKAEESSKPVVASTPFPAFGTGQGLGFGQPKPAAIQKGDSKENLPTNTPISFSAKVIGGNDAKPLGNIGNKPTSGIGDGFGVFLGNKLHSVLDSSNKDDKKSDGNSKAFGFAGISSTLTTSVGATPTFGGFGTMPKSIGSTVGSTVASTPGSTFSSAMFGSTAASTPFSSASSTTSAPFAALSTFNFNSVSSPTSGPPTLPAATKTTAKSTAPVTTAPTKPVANKPNEASVASTATASLPESTSAAASLGGLNLNTTPAITIAIASTTVAITTTTKSTAPPNVVIGAAAAPESKPTTVLTMSSTKPITSTATVADSTDSLFGSLNICKPDSKGTGDASKPPSNIFSGFAVSTSSSSAAGQLASGSGAGQDAKSVLTTPATSATSTSAKGFSFGSVTSTASNIFAKPAASATETTTATSASATAATSVAVTGTSTVTSTTVVSSKAAVVSAPVSSSSFSFGTSTTSAPATASLFVSLSSTATASTPASTTTISTAAVSTTSNIFGGSTGSSIFGQTAATSTGAITSTTSVFGGATAAISSGPSLFGSTAPTSTAAVTPASSSLFGSTAATPSATQSSGGSIFGGIPKPDQTVFAVSPNTAAPAGTGIFAAAAAATKPPTTASGGSIFGGSAVASGFGAPVGGSASGGSIFGGGTATSPFGASSTAKTSGSVFGGALAAANPTEGGSIFNSPTQQSAASGGSIFGKSTFGQPTATSPQSGGNIFGGTASQAPSTGTFGSSGGSIFGGGNAASNAASGGSIFGGAGASAATGFGSSATSTGFGSFSQPSGAPSFGSPSGGFGAPASGAFGASQQQSAFAKPVFGGPPTFGSPPAFGAQPTFGGAPTFGSPKGFGSFGSTSPAAGGFGAAAPGAPGAAASKGNIFDTLGSTDSGLSFGNLAHSTQPPAQQKPAFGGSSFMNYRS